MSEGKVPNELKTVIEGDHLVMERRFDAPRELVFQMFSDSEHLENWWGPKGWETENYAFTFAIGGVWHYCMVCTDEDQGDYYGQTSWGRAVFQEIHIPEKIVYIDQFSDEAGNVSEEFPEMDITLNFVEEAGTTRLQIISRFASAEELKTVVNMGVIEGVTSQYDRLDGYLAAIQ